MMNLGTQTGSLMNHLYSRASNLPVVGEGATLLHWSDRSAATVVWVSPSGKTARIQDDTTVRTDTNGMSETQDYTYTPNPHGTIRTVRMTKRGWRSSGTGVAFGGRRAYHDYSF